MPENDHPLGLKALRERFGFMTRLPDPVEMLHHDITTGTFISGIIPTLENNSGLIARRNAHDMLPIHTAAAAGDRFFDPEPEKLRESVFWYILQRTKAYTPLKKGDPALDINAPGGALQATPLMYAAVHDNAPAAKLLLAEKDIKLEARDKNGATALHWAAATSYREGFAVLDMLMDKGASFAAVDMNNNNALHHALLPGAVRHLSQKMKKAGRGEEYSKALCARNDQGLTPLEAVACGGPEACRSKTIEELIASGANLEAKDKNGQTVMFRLAEQGNLNMLRHLVDRFGADVHVADKDGNSLLHWAAQHDRKDIAEYLMKDRQLTGNLINKAQQSPLHSYLEHVVLPNEILVGNGSLMTMLASDGALTIPNKNNDTPLHLLIDGRKRAALELLVKCEESRTAFLCQTSRDKPTPWGHLHNLKSASDQHIYKLETALSTKYFGRAPLEEDLERHKTYSQELGVILKMVEPLLFPRAPEKAPELKEEQGTLPARLGTDVRAQLDAIRDANALVADGSQPAALVLPKLKVAATGGKLTNVA